MSHDVFLSYSRKDSKKMQRVRDGLRGAGISVWTDDNLTPGTPAWERAIEDAIESTSYLVVLLSPAAKDSEWVNREIAYAEEFKKTIIPILVSKNEQESVPIRLVRHQRVSMVGTDRDDFIAQLAHVIKTGPSLSSEAPVTPPRSTIAPPPARLDLSSLAGSTAPSRSFLNRPSFGTSEYGERLRQLGQQREKEQEKLRAEAAIKIEAIRADLPDAPALVAVNPLDQLRLLWWTIMDPDQAYIFRYKTSFDHRSRAGAWLTSLLTHTVFLLLVLVAIFGWLPVQDDFFGLPNALLLPVALVFLATGGLLAGFEFYEDEFVTLAVGLVVGIVLFSGIISGIRLAILTGLLCAIAYWTMMLSDDFHEFVALVVLILSPPIIGIVDHHFEFGLIATIPLIADIGVGAGLLMLIIFAVLAGITGGVVGSPVFQHMLGEDARLYAWADEHELIGWCIGFGAALVVCIALALGITVAADHTPAVANWIADRLPANLTDTSPDVSFTVASQDIAFSLISVTHGALAMVILILVALVTAGVWVGIGFMIAEAVKVVVNRGVGQRKAWRFSGLILGALALSYVLLLVVPVVDTHVW